MSEFVKVFGCRPHDGSAAHTGAGGKPREGIRQAVSELGISSRSV